MNELNGKGERKRNENENKNPLVVTREYILFFLGTF
jgi:hypothetical protein